MELMLLSYLLKMNKKKIERILIEIGENFSDYDKIKKQMNSSYIETGYGEFIEKDKNNESKIKNNDIKAFMDKIFSDQKNFDYIIDNIPGFIMSSGGSGEYVSSILTGRPSKCLIFEDYKDKEELKKIFEKLYNNSINELNFLTISIKGHELAVIDLVKNKGQLYLLIKNPWGCGDKGDIVSKETDDLLKDTKYSKINKNYETTGIALLNFNDIQKTFLSMSILDYEAGKYIYTESITKSQIEKSHKFDFLLNMQKKDNIKLDTVNLKTDLQLKKSDSYPIKNIQIFDENKNLIKKIKYEDVSRYSENNIVSDLEVGQKYIIRATLSDPVDFNIIRNYKENKVKFLGESNDNHFNNINNEINYTEEDEKKE